MGNKAVSGITFTGDVGHSPGSVLGDSGRKNRGQTAPERACHSYKCAATILKVSRKADS